MAGEIKRSVCPYDCPDSCGLLVEVVDGKAVHVSGDPEHTFTRGTLCPKMNHYERTVHSPLRLTSPLLRTGPKGAGQFRLISWPEAIQRVSERWREIIGKYGAEAILPYSYAGTMGLVQRNSGHPFFYRLGASRLDRTICAPAKEAGWKAVMGNTMAPHPDELAFSDLVILWGINALATNIHQLHAVREAKKRGAQVWLVETYETLTAGIADRTFVVRPSSDGALALGIMHILVRENLLDHEFLSASVQGFDELKSKILPEMTLERVRSLTGLSPETIEFMATSFGRAKSPFIRVGAGLSRYGNGGMNVRSIVCLPALVGAWRKKGGGAFVGTSTAGAFATAEITREDFMAKETRIVNMNQLGHALNHLDNPPIQGLYVYHSNPASITPDQNQVLKGLAREDLFTVVHERFMTDTAKYADVVLPSTSSLEHSDIYRAYGNYCIQRVKPAVPPVGESKSNWEVFSLLAQAMGFPEPFFRQRAEDLIRHVLSLPAPLRKGIDEKAFAAGKAVELPLPEGYKTQFKTSSGKIEIFNPGETHPLPCYLPPHDGKEAFRLMTAPSLYALNTSFREREDLRRQDKAMLLQMNPGDAKTKGFQDGERVTAFNNLGEASFILQVTSKVPAGVVVAAGVWWLEHCPGRRSVNVLTSQRLTDMGRGSTLYDNTVDVRRES
jgi:anaerobic selenocysteine-containing dehydrogenase